MTPMCFLCRRTESAFSVFGSNFIARFPRRVFVAVGGVKGAFVAFTWLVFKVVADKGLHHGHKSAGHHEEVAVEGADQLKKRVIARHDLAGFNAGDMPLADAETGR